MADAGELLRQTLRPVERADAMARLLAERRWTQKQLADALGLSVPVVSRCLTLSRATDAVKEAVASGAISEREGYECGRRSPEMQAAMVRCFSRRREQGATAALPAARARRFQTFRASGVRLVVTADGDLSDERLEAFLREILEQIRGRAQRPAA